MDMHRPYREIGNLLPNNRRQRRTCYALCHILYPVSAALTSIFRMDSNSIWGIFPLVAIAGVTLHKVVHFRASVHFRPRPSWISVHV